MPIMDGASRQTGYIPLSLHDAREVFSNDYANVADGAAQGSGGVLGKDSTPNLERVNGATDKRTRLEWAAANVDEIQWTVVSPPDLDPDQPVVFKCLAKSAGATDTPVVTVAFFEGEGDTDAGGNTGASAATEATLSRTIAAADIGAAPASWAITVKPAAHGTDAFLMYGAWLEYTRKSLTA